MNSLARRLGFLFTRLRSVVTFHEMICTTRPRASAPRSSQGTFCRGRRHPGGLVRGCWEQEKTHAWAPTLKSRPEGGGLGVLSSDLGMTIFSAGALAAGFAFPVFSALSAGFACSASFSPFFFFGLAPPPPSSTFSATRFLGPILAPAVAALSVTFNFTRSAPGGRSAGHDQAARTASTARPAEHGVMGECRSAPKSREQRTAGM